jgi:hypothetical protein
MTATGQELPGKAMEFLPCSDTCHGCGAEILTQQLIYSDELEQVEFVKPRRSYKLCHNCARNRFYRSDKNSPQGES